MNMNTKRHSLRILAALVFAPQVIQEQRKGTPFEGASHFSNLAGCKSG